MIQCEFHKLLQYTFEPQISLQISYFIVHILFTGGKSIMSLAKGLRQSIPVNRITLPE